MMLWLCIKSSAQSRLIGLLIQLKWSVKSSVLYNFANVNYDLGLLKVYMHIYSQVYCNNVLSPSTILSGTSGII